MVIISLYQGNVSTLPHLPPLGVPNTLGCSPGILYGNKLLCICVPKAIISRYTASAFGKVIIEIIGTVKQTERISSLCAVIPGIQFSPFPGVIVIELDGE